MEIESFTKSNYGQNNYLSFVPIVIFLLYLISYLSFAMSLNISDVSISTDMLSRNNNYNAIIESVFRTGWGISLVISSVVNMILLLYCLYILVSFKSTFTHNKLISISLLLAAFALWNYVAWFDLAGGVAGEVYAYIDTFDLGVSFREVINVTSANGYLGIFSVAIMLSFLCQQIPRSGFNEIKIYLGVYKITLYLTSAFLSVSILQVFLQYQWFSVFLTKDPVVKMITFGYPFIISVFYVAMFVALFLPAAEIIKQSSLMQVSDAKGKSTNNEITELFPKYVGFQLVLEHFKSLVLYCSPVLTIIIAEVAKIINQDGLGK